MRGLGFKFYAGTGPVMWCDGTWPVVAAAEAEAAVLRVPHLGADCDQVRAVGVAQSLDRPADPEPVPPNLR